MAVTSNLRTYEPFAEVVRGTPMFDWAGLFDFPRTRFTYPSLRDGPDIKMDVTEDANAYYVKAEIPGVKKEDIHVAVEGNTVSISAEIVRKDRNAQGHDDAVQRALPGQGGAQLHGDGRCRRGRPKRNTRTASSS